MLFTVIIFILVLLLYFHLMNQFKKSEDLEIYEMDYSTNTNLQTNCELRQPVLFDYQKINPELFETKYTAPESKINVRVKDVKDAETGDSIILPYSSALALMKTDNKSRFFSENNNELADNKYPNVDAHLMPSMIVNSRRDLMFGSSGATTPMRYHTEYRNFICVRSGKIQVKMTPWKSRKYLFPVSDYEHYEFRSPIDVWNTNNAEECKFLEFDVESGYVLYVPPYWFYSIKYAANDTELYGFYYNSLVNCVANIPNWFLYYLQQQNIKLKVLKTRVRFEDEVENVDKEITKDNTSL
jgi:hypothetical protein